MANDIQLVEKWLPRVVDKVFVQESLTERLFGGNAVKVDFLDAKTCKVFKVASTGLSDYKRGGSGNTNTRGAVSSSTETFTLSQERYSEIPVDGLDNLDDGGTVLGHLAANFVKEHVVMEFDAYRFSKLAGYTSATFGNRVSEEFDTSVEGNIAEKIIKRFNAAFKWMKNNKVPSENQIIYVSTSVMEAIRNTPELTKFLMQEDFKNGDITFTVQKYQGREIIEVPEDEFYTDIVIGNGYAPGAGSKAINYLIVDKSAPIIVKKLDFAKIYDSTQGAYIGYYGKLLTNLYYHDVFVPENKRVGIYCSVAATAPAAGSVLLVDAKAGTASGKTVIENVLTQPAGLIFDKLYLSTAASAPAIGSSTAALAQVYIGTEFEPNASHNYIVASYDGKAVAVSKDFTSTLPVGA